MFQLLIGKYGTSFLIFATGLLYLAESLGFIDAVQRTDLVAAMYLLGGSTVAGAKKIVK